MDDTFAIACPECGKRLKVRSELAGKKIRCKDCGHTFAVKAPSAVKKNPDPKQKAPRPISKSSAPAAKAPAKQADDGEYGEQNPYGVTELDLTPRCPHCAAELESEDAVLCINCGYNLETREHIRIVKTIENTGGDQFLWLLPGIACVVTILLLLLLDIFWLVWLPDLVEEDDILWILGSAPIALWVVISTLFAMFFCGRFAIKRLILNPTAPEKVK